MSDISLRPYAGEIDGTFTAYADFELRDGQILNDNPLFTATQISLFTDRRDNGRKGWWGGEIGSRLWTLRRAKLTQRTILKAQAYCEEALEWLTEDGVAQTVDVEVQGHFRNVWTMAIRITITRHDGRVANFRFDDAWQRIQRGNQ